MNDNMSDVMRKVVENVGKRKALPVEFMCGKCGYIVDTDSKEIRDWLVEHRPDITLDEPVGVVSPLGCRCVDPKALEERRRLHKIIEMNLPKRADTVGPRTFDNFKALPGTEEMAGAVKAWADGTSKETILTCIGITGSGKSHLLEAAVAHLESRGKSVRYERAEVMLNMLRRTFRDTEGEPTQDIQDVLDWYDGFDALILDDIGANRVTPWGIGYMYLMIDKRYADGRLLAVGTNITTPEQMESDWDARIASRLFDKNSGVAKQVWSTARDYRKAD